jgi:hypothetical protein
MTGSAGACHLAGMLDINTVFHRHFYQVVTFAGIYHCSFGATFFMG